ncbi:MAG: multidrug DMT transporter permease [Cyclobacteriaceae bacterium]|nr:MAG: multidrug DMT transporter permease [Cyclobacteriaceae bacterium]
MYIISSYTLAVFLLFISMLCWGSWANTQKLASKSWAFQLFYWDYALGLVILSLVLALTLGSSGSIGRDFITDLSQATGQHLGSAFFGGVVFNIANLLVVTAIDLAGMAIAFPIAIGLALVLGVVINYFGESTGDPLLLFGGVSLVTLAIIINAIAYRKMSRGKLSASKKGIIISIAGGIIMSFFYRFVADALVSDFANPQPEKLTPYTAVFIFSLGVLISNFLWNTIFMYKPLYGKPVGYTDYFNQGNIRLHLVGIFGGVIWCMGMFLSILASDKAGPAISYGLSQGATLVAALWGVFIWKEFKGAPKGTNGLILAMFLCFLAGLVLIIFAR